jgi:circadian clock protein KaiB
VENLRRLGSEALEGRYELEIIDVLTDPDRAEQARILTTPTVIRVHPPPARRVTGDLSRPADVLAALVPPLPHPRRPGPAEPEEFRP